MLNLGCEEVERLLPMDRRALPGSVLLFESEVERQLAVPEDAVVAAARSIERGRGGRARSEKPQER